ncbi:MAG: DEAD/DEAH box helicase, partial [Mariprofundaceae bacterium]|nr:DEAD/DEAH box helicase [Mariprofundaceae bacterium]
MQFKELNLAEPLQRAIDDMGFTELTDVQAVALPMTLAGRDVAGQGRTGTGQTAPLLITALYRLLTEPPKKGRGIKRPRALINAPTPEQVVQISD